MEHPKVLYNKLKNEQDIEEYSNKRLFKNYMVLRLEKSKKLIEIESTDQESVVKKIYPAIPGMIYMFFNIGDDLISRIINPYTKPNIIEFHDYVPILFCTSCDLIKKIIKGINLNLLPPLERLKFLSAFYEEYEEFFKRIEEKTEYQKEAINKKYVISSIIGKNPEILDNFNKKYSANFNFAFRSYKFENIKNFRMIEYEEWQYIPFYNPVTFNAIRKVELQKLYSIYKRNIKT